MAATLAMLHKDVLTADDLVEPAPEEVSCIFCLELLQNPVMSRRCRCQQGYCRKCITQWINTSRDPKCPTCRSRSITEADLQTHRFAQVMMERLVVKCGFGCPWTGKFEQRRVHYETCQVVILRKEEAGILERMQRYEEKQAREVELSIRSLANLGKLHRHLDRIRKKIAAVETETKNAQRAQPPKKMPRKQPHMANRPHPAQHHEGDEHQDWNQQPSPPEVLDLVHVAPGPPSPPGDSGGAASSTMAPPPSSSIVPSNSSAEPPREPGETDAAMRQRKWDTLQYLLNKEERGLRQLANIQEQVHNEPGNQSLQQDLANFRVYVAEMRLLVVQAEKAWLALPRSENATPATFSIATSSTAPSASAPEVPAASPSPVVPAASPSPVVPAASPSPQSEHDNDQPMELQEIGAETGPETGVGAYVQQCQQEAEQTQHGGLPDEEEQREEPATAPPAHDEPTGAYATSLTPQIEVIKVEDDPEAPVKLEMSDEEAQVPAESEADDQIAAEPEVEGEPEAEVESEVGGQAEAEHEAEGQVKAEFEAAGQAEAEPEEEGRAKAEPEDEARAEVKLEDAGLAPARPESAGLDRGPVGPEPEMEDEDEEDPDVGSPTEPTTDEDERSASQIKPEHAPASPPRRGGLPAKAEPSPSAQEDRTSFPRPEDSTAWVLPSSKPPAQTAAAKAAAFWATAASSSQQRPGQPNSPSPPPPPPPGQLNAAPAPVPPAPPAPAMPRPPPAVMPAQPVPDWQYWPTMGQYPGPTPAGQPWHAPEQAAYGSNQPPAASASPHYRPPPPGYRPPPPHMPQHHSPHGDWRPHYEGRPQDYWGRQDYWPPQGGWPPPPDQWPPHGMRPPYGPGPPRPPLAHRPPSDGWSSHAAWSAHGDQWSSQGSAWSSHDNQWQHSRGGRPAQSEAGPPKKRAKQTPQPAQGSQPAQQQADAKAKAKGKSKRCPGLKLNKHLHVYQEPNGTRHTFKKPQAREYTEKTGIPLQRLFEVKRIVPGNVTLPDSDDEQDGEEGGEE